jgi:hypothetical protein
MTAVDYTSPSHNSGRRRLFQAMASNGLEQVAELCDRPIETTKIPTHPSIAAIRLLHQFTPIISLLFVVHTITLLRTQKPSLPCCNRRRYFVKVWRLCYTQCGLHKASRLWLYLHSRLIMSFMLVNVGCFPLMLLGVVLHKSRGQFIPCISWYLDRRVRRSRCSRVYV